MPPPQEPAHGGADDERGVDADAEEDLKVEDGRHAFALDGKAADGERVSSLTPAVCSGGSSEVQHGPYRRRRSVSRSAGMLVRN